MISFIVLTLRNQSLDCARAVVIAAIKRFDHSQTARPRHR
jgi:hypothetical protein